MKQHAPSHQRRSFFLPKELVVAAILLTALLMPVTQSVAASPPGLETGGIDSKPYNEVIIYRLFYEVFSGKDIDVCPLLVAQKAVIDTPDGLHHGPEGMSRFASGLRISFPDARFDVSDLMTVGDTVVARWTMTGTHTGAFEGVAASGNFVTLDGITMLRLEDGMIVEAQVTYERRQVIQQINGDGQVAPTRVCPPCATPE